MPKLSGKELSELYPKAKTFDEIRNERALIAEQRRPRLVPAKVGLWTALTVPVVFTAYHLVVRVLISHIGTSAGPTLSGVSLSLLICVTAVALLWYLYSLIDGTASKVLAAMPLLYGTLTTILFLAGSAFATLLGLGYDATVVALIITLVVFLVAYGATQLILTLDA